MTIMKNKKQQQWYESEILQQNKHSKKKKQAEWFTSVIEQESPLEAGEDKWWDRKNVEEKSREE